MAQIIAIQLAHPQFPRSCYLVRNLETAMRFLDNAFVLKGVHWERIERLRDVEAYPKLSAAVQASPVTWTAFFQEVFPYTMVPFVSVPTPDGNKIQINDLGRIPRLKQIHKRFFGEDSQDRAFYLPPHPASILMEVMGTAMLKVDGTLYDTPCMACSRYFDHIAGNCQLVGTNSEGVGLCHMSILHRSSTTTKPQDVVHPAHRPLDPVD